MGRLEYFKYYVGLLNIKMNNHIIYILTFKRHCLNWYHQLISGYVEE